MKGLIFAIVIATSLLAVAEGRLACASGSPRGCQVQRLTLKGTYSAGGLAKVTNGNNVRRITEKNSCPRGWKIFMPASKSDWETMKRSGIQIPKGPHAIMDLTRSSNGCGGCTRHAMNSGNPSQKSWHTADGAKWWLRASAFGEPNGDYHANCFMYVYDWSNVNHIRFNDANCHYHSNTYLCQPIKGEAERLRKEEEERKRKAEAERKRKEEAERKRKEEEERKREAERQRREKCEHVKGADKVLCHLDKLRAKVAAQLKTAEADDGKACKTEMRDTYAKAKAAEAVVKDMKAQIRTANVKIKEIHSVKIPSTQKNKDEKLKQIREITDAISKADRGRESAHEKHLKEVGHLQASGRFVRELMHTLRSSDLDHRRSFAETSSHLMEHATRNSGKVQSLMEDAASALAMPEASTHLDSVHNILEICWREIKKNIRKAQRDEDQSVKNWDRHVASLTLQKIRHEKEALKLHKTITRYSLNADELEESNALASGKQLANEMTSTRARRDYNIKKITCARAAKDRASIIKSLKGELEALKTVSDRVKENRQKFRLGL